MPYRPNGHKASSADRTTWSSYEAAQTAHLQNPKLNRGVGYFFAEDDKFCGVDLDTSMDSDGNPYPWVVDILDQFADTYRAYSCSGTGLHVLCRARLEKGWNHYVPNGPVDLHGKAAQIGLFDRGRFFALTGKIFQNSCLSIGEHQATIDSLVERIKKPVPKVSTKPTTHTAALTTERIVEKATRAKNGAKFERLWEGHWENEYGSQSEADLALCAMLAFWCGGNAAQIEEVFNQSGLAREKWLKRQDYRESTIARAVAQATTFYEPRPKSSETPQRVTAPIDQGKQSAVRDVPLIYMGCRQLHEVTSEVVDSLRRANEPPVLFARSGRIVRIDTNEHGRREIRDLNEHGLRGVIARSAYFYKVDKNDKKIECVPSMDVVRDFQNLPSSEWGLPRLEMIIEAPAIRPNGTIISRPGYDAETSLYYSPPPGFVVPVISENLTADHVASAEMLLDDTFGDFLFKDDASRANLFASLLTPFVRSLIEGPTPLAIYDAPQAGTGKGLLAETVTLIVTGRSPDTFSAPRDPEEWRKKITTVLSTGAAVVLIDNVVAQVNSDALCSVLTAVTYADRRFATFEQISLPVRCTWIATGNNVRLGGDMPRRAYWIRIDAQSSRPFQRTGFRHENLRAWVTTNRGTLVAAVLVLVRYWFVAGCPAPSNIKIMGSYESWCRVVGGILECAGIGGFLGNTEAKLESSDAEAGEWEEFLLAIDRIYCGDSFRVAELLDKLTAGSTSDTTDATALRQAMPDTIAEAVQRREASCSRILGNAFSERIDRRYGVTQVHITRDVIDKKTKVARWKVVLG